MDDHDIRIVLRNYKQARRNARGHYKRWQAAETAYQQSWHWEDYLRESWYARGAMMALRLVCRKVVV